MVDARGSQPGCLYSDVNPRGLLMHASPTRFCRPIWRVSTKTKAESAISHPRFSVRCGVVITKRLVAPAPPSTYAHPDVSSNHWDNILHRPPTGLRVQHT